MTLVGPILMHLLAAAAQRHLGLCLTPLLAVWVSTGEIMGRPRYRDGMVLSRQPAPRQANVFEKQKLDRFPYMEYRHTRTKVTHIPEYLTHALIQIPVFSDRWLTRPQNTLMPAPTPV